MAYRYAFMMKVVTVRETKTFSEAVKDLQWVEATNVEMLALSKNKTWDLVPSSPYQNVIDCRWIVEGKHDAGDTIYRFKARLVTKGYAQTYGVDYEETFARWQR